MCHADARAQVKAAREEAHSEALRAHKGCFEWLRRPTFDVHLDLARNGPIALTKGVGNLAALQIFAIPDFRIMFPPGHRYRRAIRPLERAVSSWETFRAYQLNDDYTVEAAMNEYRSATKHSLDFHHFHDYACCHCLATAGRAVMVRKGVLFPRFNTPDGGPAFRALLVRTPATTLTAAPLSLSHHVLSLHSSALCPITTAGGLIVPNLAVSS